MTDDIREALSSSGCTDEEATVYAALHAQGLSTDQTLAEKTGIDRPTVLGVLRTLRDRGFVYEEEREGVPYFFAVEIVAGESDGVPPSGHEAENVV